MSESVYFYSEQVALNRQGTKRDGRKIAGGKMYDAII